MYHVWAETHACAKDSAHIYREKSSGMMQLRPLQEHGLGSGKILVFVKESCG
jgi:hypothetical protein